jgi:hypothetical protein
MCQNPRMPSRQKHEFSASKGLRWTSLAAVVIAFILMLKRPAAVAEPLPPSLARAENEQFQAKWAKLERAHQRGERIEARFTSDEISSALDYPGQPGHVSFAGDIVTGQFIANVHGRNVYVTISGKLGAADGYLTFEPAEFKIGDMPVPVALFKTQLEDKLADPETHARLKLPDYIADLRIEDSELVVVEK